jgi:hypothetical protein
LEVGGSDRELLLDRGQRDVDDAEIELEHELRSADQCERDACALGTDSGRIRWRYRDVPRE